MRTFFSIIFCLIFGSQVFGQLTLTNGNNVLEFGGAITTYYNHRIYKPGQTDFKKNRFKLRDAQIKLEGRIANDYEYEVQFDFANLGGALDPENPPLMDAYIIYKGLSFADFKVGFQKLPYSRSSLVPFFYSPFFQRSEFVRGEVFSRRDVGLTVMKDFYNGKVNAMFGAYTGMGEFTLAGNNDLSGNLEYIGRVDFSYPSKYKYRELDVNVTAIPVFQIGLNARFAEKGTTLGKDYQLTTIDGSRTLYGADLSIKYMGFSAQLEAHQMVVNPKDTLRFFGESNDGSFLAGGMHAQINYFSKKLNSSLSARYENFNLNNHYQGVNERLSFAYTYQIDGWNSAIKMQYTHILNEEQNAFFPEGVVGDLNWDAQFRIGWQLQFK